LQSLGPDLDAVVWQEVERLLQDPGRLADEYQRRLDEAHSGGHERADIATLEAQMAKLRRGIGRLIDSYAEGMIDKVDFDPRITGLRQRLVNLEDCCKVLRDQAAVQTTLSLIIGRLEDFADHVRDTLSASDWHQRRELIRLLVKRVEIDVDAINIVFRVAPAPSDPGPAAPRSPSLQDCGWRDRSTACRCRAQRHGRHRSYSA
jgi:site-specific DNA recombinase